MYQRLTERLREALAGHIREKYGVELAIVLERPPKIEMGEAASPVCFELAKRLKRAPRQIAQEIANGLGVVEGIAKVEVAGGGYLNAYFDREAFWEGVKAESGEENGERTQRRDAPTGSGQAPDAEKNGKRQKAVAAGGENGKIIVEHTSINPNKAAHIGHVRNAVLGDTMVRILRHAGNRVQIQNYIDNTGVQVADVVIGFLHMEQRTPVGVKMMAMEPKFDYHCWDLYAKATNFLAEDKARAAKLRGETLKSIEEGKGEDAEVAQVVADAIVGCHLRTMARLDIGYELLARESEILHLKFWDAAFEMLKKSGAIQLATSGKMAGCWIMPWKDEEHSRINAEGTGNTEDAEKTEEDENSQDKIIVRSNGTVTYVGKDIAYQLWKFGLLGKDFHYRKWPTPPQAADEKDAPEGQTVWATTSGANDTEAPHFGEPASSVYNVIDARQAYLQKVVAAGLRALGHAKAAEQSIHLSYEIVALTPRCAAEMGYELTPEEAKKPHVEVSGRKGFGVKADDLLDKLEAATLAEVKKRHPSHHPAVPDLPSYATVEQHQIAHAIAVGALRFFLLKFTRNAIIAFDFKDALSFEGETGPYCQYAVVRIRGIRRKGAEAGATNVEVTKESVSQLLAGAEENSLWELLVAAGSLDYAVDAAIATQEPAFMAKYAFQLAQAFNNFYHKHHILSEADEQKQAFLLRLTELVEAQLVRALSLLGIESPEKM
ncbi:MAG TPA: arginine--tRNA ligase [Candidatus Acidoferrum sp.]|nr:arginine--tRNA ligase [Candidatus Acidoferrum sp.]